MNLSIEQLTKAARDVVRRETSYCIGQRDAEQLVLDAIRLAKGRIRREKNKVLDRI